MGAACLTTACGGGTGSPDEGASSAPEEALTAEVRVARPNALAIADEAMGRSAEEGLCEEGEDFKSGSQVELLDASGATVATSELVPVENINAAGKICAWSAEFEGVPSGGDFYSAKLGKYQSDKVAEADLGDGLTITP